ncbi:MAG: C1 family peptidase [Bacteroidia bacterium]|nr:C1 family peptidase [Bacteroidia bacterium]
MKSYFSLLLCCILLSPLMAQEKYAGGLEFDDVAYEGSAITVPLVRDATAARLPNKASLKAYAPKPQNQGQYNNCVGWSSAYAARTILYNKASNIKQGGAVNVNAFSPAFTYRLISTDQSCFTPTSIEKALRSLKERGVVPKRDFDYACSGSIPSSLYPVAKRYTIDDYSRLFFLKDPQKLKLLSVKKAIADGSPVIIGMKCTPSFERSDGMEVWNRAEELNTTQYFGHAMCVVSYDNKKFGGAFEIMNSWGQGWGNGGFIWVKYDDFVHFAKYAYVPMGSQGSPTQGSRPQIASKENPSPKSRPNATQANKPGPKKSAPKSYQKQTQNSYTKTASASISGLAGEVKLIRSDGDEMQARLYGNLYRTKERYAKGTKFRIQLSTANGAYVYVLGTDASYKTVQLFPQKNGGNALLDGSSAPMNVPDSRHYIQLDESDSDRDYLCVIFAKNPLNISSIQEKIEAASGTLTRRVQQALGSEMVSARNVQYENGKIAFNSLKDSGELVSLIIETRRQL